MSYEIREIDGKFFVEIENRPFEPILVSPLSNEPWEGFATAQQAERAAELLIREKRKLTAQGTR